MNLDTRIAEVLESVQYKMRGNPHFSLTPLLDSIHGSNLSMIEIGSFTGESAEQFALSGKFSSITCIDSWCNDPKSDAFVHCDMALAEQLFIIRTYKYPAITRIKEFSVPASCRLNDHSLDFVYIDADHEYDAVKQDILHWLPKVKHGGYIGGHDFSIYHPGVVIAVQENFTSFELFPDTSWLVKL